METALHGARRHPSHGVGLAPEAVYGVGCCTREFPDGLRRIPPMRRKKSHGWGTVLFSEVSEKTRIYAMRQTFGKVHPKRENDSRDRCAEGDEVLLEDSEREKGVHSRISRLLRPVQRDFYGVEPGTNTRFAAGYARVVSVPVQKDRLIMDSRAKDRQAK